MCGIAGIIDLVGQRPAPEGVVQRMARAITHRGPDEEGFLEQPGISLASRRLSIVDLADGQQPMTNEDRSVFVVFNGELFDYVERREELVKQGHRFRTHCDTEIIPHLWEDHHEGIWERLRGQFAIALWDARLRQLHLGRDRFGIAPLFCLRQEWFHHDPIARDSITCSPSPPCRGRGPVSKVFNSCHQDTACALRREVRARVRSLPNAPTGKWIFRRRVKRNGETIRMRW